MSIREVENIPQNLSEKRQSYRDMIRKDIQEAIDKHIENFEFEGDYNYKYLAQYAREEANNIFNKNYRPAAQKVKNILKEEFSKEYIFPESQYNYTRKFIKIHSTKLSDRIHVYASIDYDFLNNFYNTLLEDTRKHYNKLRDKAAE